jgi:hypothetical protein
MLWFMLLQSADPAALVLVSVPLFTLQGVAEAAARDVQQPAVQAQGQRHAGQGAFSLLSLLLVR